MEEKDALKKMTKSQCTNKLKGRRGRPRKKFLMTIKAETTKYVGVKMETIQDLNKYR